MQKNFPPSYLYLEYNGDPDVGALVAAQNAYQQAYLDEFNGLNLPIYSTLSGDLLDWVGTNLYGLSRPIFSVTSGVAFSGGDYNTWRFNEQDYNSRQSRPVTTFQVATDDQYQRCLTWDTYTGDGRQFNSTWLKRRVLRFLTGAAGTDPGIQETYLIGVVYGAANAITINCDHTLPNIDILTYAMQGGFLRIPFQYTYTVASV